ncbi:hypothetical protein GQ457_06G022720 [Hibiscus cannabinus]
MFSSKSSTSSSFSTVNATRYDIFLSFRGLDTRLGFLSHLHKDLKRKKIEAFIDEEKLPRGEGISETLLKAIQESRGSLIVFSQNYASSTWCLDELVKIMHCKNLNPQHYFVLPVFYHVDPSDVRNQRGSFSDAFAKHEENFKHDVEKVKFWRTALTQAANSSGWDSHVTRPESTLIDEIVKDILKKLNHGTSCAYLKDFVGMERRMEHLMSLFQKENPDFLKLGIWGMAGIGKTTLAEAIFNHVSNGFESVCFLPNLRESEEHGRLFELRQKFLSTILEDGFLKDRLYGKMVLVVCDDVSNSSQLEFLFRGIDQFGPGSRVIITTRDRQVLIQNDIDLIYGVEELDGNESVQLFCQRAFKTNHPKEYQIELSKQVLSFANGNPLAIKVFGSSLYGKNQSYQEGAVKKLKQIPNPDIHKLVRSSFDGLDCEEQDMFLDIACFYKGEDRHFVTRIMDACYVSAHSGIDSLIDKSLISVSGNMITMHDLLQQMGQAIVRNESPSEPERRSRLWIADDIYDVLRENNGTKILKGILLDISRISELELKPDVLVKMPNLKFLKFYRSDRYNCFQKKSKICLPQGLSSLPNELRYLCWEGYPLRTLPPRIDPRNLVELDLSYSNVEFLWEGKQDLVNLKKITLNYSENLLRIRDLSSATNLEEMDLFNCKNLLELPSLYKVTSLTSLDLGGCSNIFQFPEVSSNVRRLYLEGTSIEQVPSSLEFLSELVTLSMDNCVRLKNIPTAVSNLRSLHRLSLNDCSNITTFPEISANIKELNLAGTAIEDVPSSIECLSNLCILNLARCWRLKSVSTSIHRLKSLEIFILEGCSRLEIFPEILETMNLGHLDLSRTALKELPCSIENLIFLFELRLNNCENLVCLPNSFYKLKSLTVLLLGGCSRLKNFPEILETMERLRTLDLSGTALKELPSSMENLVGLEYLRLDNFENFVCLPANLFSAIGGASLKGRSEIHKHPNGLFSLRKLILRERKRLKSFPGLPPSLELLDAPDCTSLEDVSSIKKHFEKLLGTVYQQAFHRVTYFMACVTGSEIAEWFDYKSIGSSINIQLPLEWYNNSRKNFPGFVVSAVVSFQDYSDSMEIRIRCDCHLKSSNGGCLDLSYFAGIWRWGTHNERRLFGLDQLFLLCDEYKIRRFVETQASNDCVYNEASFKFYAVVYRGYPCTYSLKPVSLWKVKQCGVHPIFAESAVMGLCNLSRLAEIWTVGY